MKKIKFEKAVDEYLEINKLKLKMNSYRSMNNRITNCILPYFKNKYIHKISTRDYINWQLEISKKNYSIRYKKNLHVCFVTFLNYCIKNYGIKQNVAQIVGNFRETEYIEEKIHIWDTNMFNTYISNINENDIIHKCIIEFLYLTGVRLGEATALTYNDIDFTNNTIHINKNMTRYIDSNGKRIITTPKTKKSIRTISFNNYIKNSLLELKKYYEKEYGYFKNQLFIFGGIKPMSFTTLERKKNYYCKLANVPQIKIHDLRHSHACLLFQNNVPIDEISFRLGHSSISMTTDIYLQFLPKQEKRVLEALNSLTLII